MVTVLYIKVYIMYALLQFKYINSAAINKTVTNQYVSITIGITLTQIVQGCVIIMNLY